MIDIIYMVGIWQCHIPTPNHHVIFPPGGNMTGGNVLVSHDDDDDDEGDDDDNITCQQHQGQIWFRQWLECKIATGAAPPQCSFYFGFEYPLIYFDIFHQYFCPPSPALQHPRLEKWGPCSFLKWPRCHRSRFTEKFQKASWWWWRWWRRGPRVPLTRSQLKPMVGTVFTYCSVFNLVMVMVMVMMVKTMMTIVMMVCICTLYVAMVGLVRFI